ncbi:hypothetical protein DP923_00785 [Pontibacter arcticus]|uniref:Tail specific protease domain-containing protein n=1 Tax=Pontibacter arcticus TaxID=2080288 RepID=A0A364RH92_9BACT|nr:hypothetical protein DP923_00785 [Pontibacter arcticus]
MAQRVAKIKNSNHYTPDSTLTDRQVDNLFAFAKVYGYVKYFYPLKDKEHINWNFVATAGTQKIISAENSVALRDSLTAFFRPIAPLLKISSNPEAAEILSKKALQSTLDATESSGRYYYNYHEGLGQDKQDLPPVSRIITSSLYKSKTLEADQQTYFHLVTAGTILPVDSLYSAQIGEDLFCSLPLVLTEKNYENNQAYKRHRKKYKPNLNLHHDRIANLVILWNIFQHFHPYLENTGGWNKVFFRTMKQASPAMDKNSFAKLQYALIASLKDGHANIANSNSIGIYKRPTLPAIETGWIEGQIVVTKVNMTDTTIQQGDILEKIDSVEANVAVENLKKYTSSADEHNLDLIAGERVLSWQKTVSLKITDSAGNRKDAMLSRNPKLKKVVKPATIRKLDNNIYLLDASTLNEKEIETNLTELKQAKGIIVDLRTRPSANFLTGVLPYFIKAEVETGNWFIPHYTFPDQVNVKYKPTGKYVIKPNGKYLNAAKVFLIGHHTFSYGETCAEVIDHYKLGKTIGWYTASTNGNINFSGIGKQQTTWTGMKVMKRDGSPYHGVGIKPEILVEPNLHDIRSGKASEVEAAIKYLTGY